MTYPYVQPPASWVREFDPHPPTGAFQVTVYHEGGMFPEVCLVLASSPEAAIRIACYMVHCNPHATHCTAVRLVDPTPLRWRLKLLEETLGPDETHKTTPQDAEPDTTPYHNKCTTERCDLTDGRNDVCPKFQDSGVS